jgi:thioredoxin reductase
VDDAGRCGLSGLYAAGDVCNPRFPSVVSAIAHGAVVAKTIELDNRTS